MSFSEQKYKSFKPVYSCKYFRILHKNSTKQSLDISISRKYFKLAVNRNKIKRRIRKHVFGSESRPRLSVFRSNKEIYAQIVDDVNGKTLVSASSRDKDIADDKKTKIELSKLVGISVGSKAVKAGIEKIGFDRSGYLYHGRVKSLAEGARESGLKF